MRLTNQVFFLRAYICKLQMLTARDAEAASDQWIQGALVKEHFEFAQAPEPPLRDNTLQLLKANLTLTTALMVASNTAYMTFFDAVENALLRGETVVQLQDPSVYRVGRFEFHWTVFVYGLKRAGKRDRSYWSDRGFLVPFEQLRRVLAKKGVYVVLNYESGLVVRVFTRADIEGNPDFSVMLVQDRPLYVYKRAERNFYNIVPF